MLVGVFFLNTVYIDLVSSDDVFDRKMTRDRMVESLVNFVRLFSMSVSV